MDLRPRHLGRYRQIVQTLAKHGFGYVVEELGLRRYLPFGDRALRMPSEHGGPTHLRQALQELGATFIKAGQLLSTRADLLPPEYVEELSHLQDALPPLPVETIAKVVERELRGRPEDVFGFFDPRPLAAASTSQVHGAVLAGGEEVVVKVQRPGVASLFAVDLEILRHLATLATNRTGLGRDYDLLGIVEEMALALRAGLDYRREARNAEIFRANFLDSEVVVIPRIFEEYSTSVVLTLERLRGVKITDFEGLARLGIDRRELAQRSARVLLKMVFEDGFFHADPHPGNYYVLPDGRLGMMDFGLVGWIGDNTRDELSRLFLAVIDREPDRMVDALAELGALRRPRERPALVWEMERLVNEYADLPLGEISLGQLMGDALRIAQRRGLQLPTNLTLLATVVAANEGVGRWLDPEFRLLESATPYAQHLVARVYDPRVLLHRLRDGLVDAADAAPQLPGRVHSILRELERGNVEVGVRSEQIDRLTRQAVAAANRLALSVLIAAFVVSLAVLMVAFDPPGFGRFSLIVLSLGFLVAMALGVWLIISMLRSE